MPPGRTTTSSPHTASDPPRGTRFAGSGGIAISIVAWIAITIVNIVFNERGKR